MAGQRREVPALAVRRKHRRRRRSARARSKKRAGPQTAGARKTSYRCSLPGLAGFEDPHVARGFWAGYLVRPTGCGHTLVWRRGWDLNPRSTFWADTRFPVVHLRPLGHLSRLSSRAALQVSRIWVGRASKRIKERRARDSNPRYGYPYT